MNNKENLGGIIQTYQKYDPMNFPSPTAPPPDLVTPAMEHMMQYGSTRDLTEEELANAIHLDPSQIRGLGPSIDYLKQMLEERKRKILETYETSKVSKQVEKNYKAEIQKTRPPEKFSSRFKQATQQEQIYDLERIYYAINDDSSPFANQIVQLIEKLGEKYQVEELTAKYEFKGREGMDVPKALEIKEELESIDKLLQQLEEAKKNAKIALIDMEELAKYIEENDLNDLKALQENINQYMKEEAERQGITQDKKGFQLTPKAFRLFQSKLLQTIFNELNESRTGRHGQQVILGEGATELQTTKPYEFGDSISQMDIPASMVNAMLRQGNHLPVRMKAEDIEIHRTRNIPKCATTVLLDMSGSMRYDGMFVNVKRMGLALEGLIRSEYPGDFLQFIEMYTFAKARKTAEVVELMPKPVTIFNPVVRMRADMSDPNISEMQIPPHFTNIQHAMRLGRQYLSVQDTPNRQMILITDGLPTAHFEGNMLYLLYPPDPRTEEATLREAQLCAKEGITINIFLLQSWNQSEEDVRFAYKVAEMTKGRVVFTAGRDLDRFVVWDYVKQRKSIIT
jgi:uncharacterized protein with von Willebrand factor type A (vWA) domain